jgi:lysophospholipase L1-like esterase
LLKAGMLIRRFLACAFVLALSVASAEGANVRLRRMVVVGDSLLAGFGSGGLVERGLPGQVDSVPSIIAVRARVRLPQPFMDSPGVPPPYTINDRNKNGVLDAGEVRRISNGIGFRKDPRQGVRNLAVPGEDTASVFETIDAGDIASRLVRHADVNGQEVLKFLILGLPPHSGAVSQVTLTRDLDPSFILLWIGNNDVLPLATHTNPNAAASPTPAEFGNRFRRLLDALADNGVGMAVANLPDVTGIAALRRAAGDVTACTAADGTTQPVAPDDLLSIDLDPALLPTPPCGRVLDTAEQAAVRAKVIAFNDQIAAAIADVSARRGTAIALVDVFTLFDQAKQGIDINADGTPDVNTRYLGGIFSLDGVHPTLTGNAIIANAFITAINARFGESITLANVPRVFRRDRLAHNRFRPAGEVPFGLIGDSATDDVQDQVQTTFDRIERNVRRIGDDLQNAFNVFRRFF